MKMQKKVKGKTRLTALCPSYYPLSTVNYPLLISNINLHNTVVNQNTTAVFASDDFFM